MMNITSDMDLESAMMAVQTNRANLLETQLKDQISAVQQKNEKIAKLNELLGSLNKIAANLPSDAKADKQLSVGDELGEVQLAANAAGVTIPENKHIMVTWTTYFKDGTTLEADGGLKYLLQSSSDHGTGKAVDLFRKNINMTKGDLDGFIQQTKSQIDSMSNSQQMDMLRLQSLNNKRNEAFDLMTNFIKKSQDSRSSIIGNTR